MTKKFLTLALRLGVSGAMLAYLVVKIEHTSHTESGGHGVFPPWNATTAAWLSAATLLTFLSVVLLSMRWRAVLHALGVREQMPSIHRLNALHLAGMFVGNVLPSTVGGDVLRVTRLRRDVGDGTVSFASVVLERLTGWVVLPMLILVGFTVNRGFLEFRSAARPALAIAVVTLVLLVGVITIMSSTRLAARFDQNAGWRRFAMSIHIGMNHYRQDPWSAFTVITWGVAYQLALIASVFCAARTLGVDAIGFTAILTFFPAILIVQVLPISISGLGLREGLFVLFLRPLGVPDGKAVALGILVYLLTLVVSLAGAPSFAFGRRQGEDDPVAGPQDLEAHGWHEPEQDPIT